MNNVNSFICSFIKFILAVVITGELFILAGYDTSKISIRNIDTFSIYSILIWGMCFTTIERLLTKLQRYSFSKGKSKI